MKTKWETVIGLEVHAELSTATKIFCACVTRFGAPPNTQSCPVCSGMPGTLPVFNRVVAEYAMKLGLALKCNIADRCKFDRKNYTYPDLPKSYQVSQLYAPICTHGSLEVDAPGGTKSIGIHQIHMEEDAGKLIHDGGHTFMDFNRCGVPLLEIVSKPDMRSADEAVAYLEKLRETLLYLEICDCKMQEGSLRADVNLSIRPVGGPLGIRTETKNLNSFKAIARAIQFETARQIEILEAGGVVTQETRRWDDDQGESYSMRTKEDAQDYRYFPEPDLLPIHIDTAWLARIRETLPEMAHKKRARYIRDLTLSPADAAVLTGHIKISFFFETLAKKSGHPKEAANLIIGEITRLMNKTGILPENLDIDTDKLTTLITLVLGNKINRNAYKDATEAVFLHDADPETYIRERGLLMVSDNAAIEAAVDAVLATNPDAVASYRAGKEKIIGFLIGQVMKKFSGAGSPDLIKELLIQRINETQFIQHENGNG
ncbi:MAG: Asp-tRNA(Asn)/Glu-tRNA(Gln) amidotransferase subunit GatB [Defluviitaleaceae bacterium]|nr:Asp-tRNA(Asn)/Glu-tRNA(Gln) amidotransferase subunit GatB [Defluviitaleaceae bacterium]MCL2238948.1 Asp-tRNA(Asn)/Glu-tRNA(Gln) amidotransferase subunit GatB [Defluviitaleaceae bacterium]